MLPERLGLTLRGLFGALGAPFAVLSPGTGKRNTRRLLSILAGLAAAAVLVCGSSLASYCVYLRLKYNCVVTLGGVQFVMGLEALAMLAALAFSAAVLAYEIKNRGERT